MDFNSRKFWVAQSLAAVVTVLVFLGSITVDEWMTRVMMIEAGWGVLDVGTTAVKGLITKKNGNT
jgi:hypothetical protein